jgi:hypothetical protein
MSSLNTQITSAFGYNTKNIIFSKPTVTTIPNSNPPIKFTRVNINTKNSDGTLGELIFETERLYSYGVGENKDPKTGEINGFSMPICLWTKDNPSEREKEWVKTFESVVDVCKDYIYQHREELGKDDLEMSDLRKLNPLYYKKEGKKIVEGVGPTLYAKLIQNKKLDRIESTFYDEDENEIDPNLLKGKRCYVTAAIKIESIFVGNRISIQVKLYEAIVKILDGSKRRLLGGRRPVADMVVSVGQDMLHEEINDTHVDEVEDEDEDETGSIHGSDREDQDQQEEKPEPTKKVVKKVVIKKVVKKAT